MHGWKPATSDATSSPSRILQNLVLNALKVTQSGGVRVTWEAGEEAADSNQWALCVQDTGPGFKSAATPIKTMLKDATEAARDAEESADAEEPALLTADPAPTLTSESSARGQRVPRGEGIGLSIVKRLCELLDASIELQSSPGQGTTFRVVFPRAYPQAAGAAN
jgi:signal transduction histidine kinase